MSCVSGGSASCGSNLCFSFPVHGLRASATAGWMSWGSPCAQGVLAMLTARSAALVCLRARGLTDCGAGGEGGAGDGDSRIYAYIASACSFCAVG